MSKLFCLSLLCLLVITWCGSRVESRRWKRHKPQTDINPDCKCKVMPNMRVACLKQAMPQSYNEKINILKCLCKKHRFERRMDLNLRRTCKKIFGDFSIPLTLA